MFFSVDVSNRIRRINILSLETGASLLHSVNILYIIQRFCKRTVKVLISLRSCAAWSRPIIGWSRHSCPKMPRSHIFAWCGSFNPTSAYHHCSRRHFDFLYLSEKIRLDISCESSVFRRSSATFLLSAWTFTTLCAISADDKQMIFFFYFSHKIGFDVSCKLSPKEMSRCMKCRSPFLVKIRKTFQNVVCWILYPACHALRVNR